MGKQEAEVLLIMNDETSDSKQQLPRMDARTLAKGQKRRKGMRLDLPPDGGQMPFAEEI